MDTPENRWLPKATFGMWDQWKTIPIILRDFFHGFGMVGIGLECSEQFRQFGEMKKVHSLEQRTHQSSVADQLSVKGRKPRLFSILVPSYLYRLPYGCRVLLAKLSILLDQKDGKFSPDNQIFQYHKLEEIWEIRGIFQQHQTFILWKSKNVHVSWKSKSGT